MVCVDGARLAVEFGRMFDLKSVVNCYIPSRGYMPVGYCFILFASLIIFTYRSNRPSQYNVDLANWAAQDLLFQMKTDTL
jgi:hypothetical protein